MAHFSLIDFFILIILAWCISRSAMRGFVREVLGLAAVLLALLVSAWFYHRASSLFKDVVKTENLALFFAFTVIFLGTLLAGALVIWLVTRFMKFAKLQWFDRLLGGAFGFIRAWVLIAIVLLGLTAFDVQTERIRNSGLAPYFLPGSRVVAVMTPFDLKARFLVGYRAVEQWWREHR
jgi:membrane protein required for colicin V production